MTTLDIPQPVGIPPVSTHTFAPYCDVSDIPPDKLRDAQGNQIGDVSIEEAIVAAMELLYRRVPFYRQGRSVVRPSQIQNAYGSQSYLYPYASMSGYGSAWGFAAGWAWTAIGMGWWQSGQDLSEIRLQYPVQRINSVMVDGVILPPTSYSLYSRRVLIRNIDQEGGQAGAWPWNQQLQLPITETGTWQIDYTWGRPAPMLAKFACIEVATAIIQAISGQDRTALPARVTSVNTQGVSVAVADALKYVEANLTGLPVTDQYISSENPTGRRRARSLFISPNSVIGHSS